MLRSPACRLSDGAIVGDRRRTTNQFDVGNATAGGTVRGISSADEASAVPFTKRKGSTSSGRNRPAHSHPARSRCWLC